MDVHITLRCSGTSGLVIFLAEKSRKKYAQNGPIPSLKSVRRPLIVAFDKIFAHAGTINTSPKE